MIGLEKNIVKLIPYTPRWAELFNAEKKRLLGVVKDSVRQIEHVGSTAIPGGVAKPIIDIAIGIEDYQEAFRCVEPVVQLGYEYKGEFGISRRHYFVRSEAKKNLSPTSTHHIHMLELTSAEWQKMLQFRNYLLTHPAYVAEYAALKLRLMEQYPTNREAYTKGKTSFVNKVLRLAWLENQTAGDEQSSCL